MSHHAPILAGTLLAVLLVAWGPGCAGAGEEGDAGGMDAGPLPGIPCSRDGDCKDDIACTVNRCGDDGYCRTVGDDALCDDGVYCNGVELCDHTEGCIRPTADACNDFNTCTIDACLEDEKRCVHTSRDLDDDGDVDDHCAGGTDCDDRDATRSGLKNEICLDTVDNDCDGLIDEGVCGGPPHDLCDDALDVTAGGVFELFPAGAARDYEASCALGGGQDLAFSFTLTEAKDVDVGLGGPGVGTVALFDACGEADSEFECDRGVTAAVRARALPPGTYGGVVVTTSSSAHALSVSFSDPSPAPTNESCAAPVEILASGTVAASLVDVAADHSVSCLAGAGGDLVFLVTTEATQNLRFSATAGGTPVAVSVRTACDDGSSELRCARSSAPEARLYEAAAGDYFVVLKAPPSEEPDVDLTVEVTAPTPPPAGDVCSTAFDLALGVPTAGTLVGAEDDVDLGCGLPYRDVVYAVTLEDTRDLQVSVDAGGSLVYAAIQSPCGEPLTELACVGGSDPIVRARSLPAGTYFVVLEAFGAPAYTVTASSLAPTTPQAVAGNDTCGTAQVVPAAGGLYTGVTTGLGNDLDTLLCLDGSGPDAVFSLTLPAQRTVTVSTAGSNFDTVVSLYDGACGPVQELFCDDSGGPGETSFLAEVLAAGTYFIVVDGFAGASGAYVLDVSVDP